MFIFSFGGATSTIQKNKITRVQYHIQYQQQSQVMEKGSSCLGIMQVDGKEWRAEIRVFNGCSHYAVIKVKLNFPI